MVLNLPGGPHLGPQIHLWERDEQRLQAHYKDKEPHFRFSREQSL